MPWNPPAGEREVLLSWSSVPGVTGIYGRWVCVDAFHPLLLTPTPPACGTHPGSSGLLGTGLSLARVQGQPHRDAASLGARLPSRMDGLPAGTLGISGHSDGHIVLKNNNKF